MDMNTTAKSNFRPYDVHPKYKAKVKVQKEKIPFQNTTAYSCEYPNWGPSEMLIEKTPQYPIY